MFRRVAITGAGGRLGSQLVRAFQAEGDEVLPLSHLEFDITQDRDLARLTEWRPEVVVNSAAWTDVDGCAENPERALLINGTAAGMVAKAAARAGARTVQVSTNEVFDGTLDRAYTEEDEPNPINPYGESKLTGERLVSAADVRNLIVRTAWLFGPDGPSFVTKIANAAVRARAEGVPLRVVEDEWGNPTPTPWLASTVVDICRHEPESVIGVIHAAGLPATTRLGWAQQILTGTTTTIDVTRLADFPRPSRVPPRATLAMGRLEQIGIPPVDWRPESATVVGSLRA